MGGRVLSQRARAARHFASPFITAAATCSWLILSSFAVAGAFLALPASAGALPASAGSEENPVPPAFQQFLDSRPRVPKLPVDLKGRWRWISTGDMLGSEVNLATELQVTNQDDYGNITGLYMLSLPSWGTRPEAMCMRGDRLPMTGRYDGETLQLVIKRSMNGPGCTDFWLTFHRGKQHLFERGAADDSAYWYYDAAE